MSDEPTKVVEHGEEARRLLELLARQEDEVRDLSPDEHLSMVVDGRLKSLNASRDWTLEVAKVHALLAIADAIELGQWPR